MAQSVEGDPMNARYLIGDVFERLSELPDGSVDLIVTSPPFLALRSYLPPDHPEKAKEIGSEATPAEFLDVMLRLTAEWRRVLAPHGSLAVELGDTYTGAGGYGSPDSPNPVYGQARFAERWEGRSRKRFKTADDGWPLAKSKALIPELYRIGLAYGINPLTGVPSPAGRWLVRNVVTWCRPNPPVGALGDKWRPATSDVVIACTSGSRYWNDVGTRAVNPDGTFSAPLKDWWEISAQGYKGSHYATFPAKLVEPLVKAMAPHRVCTVCGEPSRPIIEAVTIGRASGSGSWIDGANGSPREDIINRNAPEVPDVSSRRLVGWTDCGHGSYACASCGASIPSDYAIRRPGKEPSSPAPVGDEAVLGEPLEGTSQSAHSSRDLRDVRSGVSRPPGGEMLHTELFGEAGAQGGSTTDPAATNDSDRAEDAYWQGRSHLRAGMGASGLSGPTEEWVDDGAPQDNAGPSGPAIGALGDRASSQRHQDGQSSVESRSSYKSPTRGHGDLPPLSGNVPGELAEGYVCSCGSREIKYVADHWRNGVVLDPFAGSGTTLRVATGHGLDAIGFDLDERNAEMALERVGPLFLDVERK